MWALMVHENPVSLSVSLLDNGLIITFDTLKREIFLNAAQKTAAHGTHSVCDPVQTACTAYSSISG